MSIHCKNYLYYLYFGVFLIIAATTAVDHCTVEASFADDFYITGGEPEISADGLLMQLVLNNKSASGFASHGRYLFGSIDMKIKLIPGDSAGTVTAYYLSSDVTSNDVHDEIDFEFLGNVTGQPYILQTNIFASGKGEREQRIYLWFDPSLAYHTYSVLWNPQQIILSIDGTPIRRFPNNEASGLAYPDKQPMRIYGSLWDGNTWATRGGLDKINWMHSPFITTFTGFHVEACPETNMSSCPMDPSQPWNQPVYQTLSSQQQAQLQWVQQNYMVYDYCTDSKRYPVPPLECSNSNSASSSPSSSVIASAPTASVSNSSRSVALAPSASVSNSVSQAPSSAPTAASPSTN